MNIRKVDWTTAEVNGQRTLTVVLVGDSDVRWCKEFTAAAGLLDAASHNHLWGEVGARDFATHVGSDEAALAAEAVTDPAQTVQHDVKPLRSSTVLSTKITVSGHVYDVDTGVITTIVPASPLRTS